MEGGGFWQNCLSSVLASMGQCKEEHSSPKVEAELKKKAEEPKESSAKERLCLIGTKVTRVISQQKLFSLMCN